MKDAAAASVAAAGLLAPVLPGLHAPMALELAVPLAGLWYARYSWWPHQRAVNETPRMAGDGGTRIVRPWRRDHGDPRTHGFALFRTFQGYRLVPEGLGFWARTWRQVWGVEEVAQARHQVNTVIWSPPRMGKTKQLLVKAILAWGGGPRIVISTRRDLVDACAAKCSHDGLVWVCDVRGELGDLRLDARHRFDDVRMLYWSPLRGCDRWEVALERAEDLALDAGEGSTNASHWKSRAVQLLATLLHGAALDGVTMSTVAGWIARKNLNDSQDVLKAHRATFAIDLQKSLEGTADNELKSIWSALTASVRPFYSEAIRDHADRAPQCPFDPADFLAGSNTLFIVASADASFSVAPLVVGLFNEIYKEVTRISGLLGRLPLSCGLFGDEIANTCPIPNLGAVLADGGGRGFVSTLVFQDMEIAQLRWGPGFATTLLQMCGSRIVLPGGGDDETLAKLERLAGRHDVPERRANINPRRWCGLLAQRWPKWPFASSTWSVGTKSEPLFSEGGLRKIPRNHAFLLNENDEACLVRESDFDACEPFATWAAMTAPSVAPKATQKGSRGLGDLGAALGAWWLSRRPLRPAPMPLTHLTVVDAVTRDTDVHEEIA